MNQYNTIVKEDLLQIEIHQPLDTSSILAILAEVTNSSITNLSIYLSKEVSADFMLIQAISYLKNNGKNIRLNQIVEPSAPVQSIVKSIINNQ